MKDIRDKAEAMAAYARQARDTQLVEYATEIKVRAERRCGELTAVMHKTQGQRTSPEHAEKSKRDQLSVVGVSTQEASRYQQLAAMPEKHFEAAIAAAEAVNGDHWIVIRPVVSSRPLLGTELDSNANGA